MINNTIALASDHAGATLRKDLALFAQQLGWTVLDLGSHEKDSVDYPDFAHAGIDAILKGTARFSILICGTGIGMSIAANRFSEIRAALCHHEYEAKVARQHNDANVLCLGGRITGPEIARRCLRIFLSTEFCAEERHQRRLNKIDTFPSCR